MLIYARTSSLGTLDILYFQIVDAFAPYYAVLGLFFPGLSRFDSISELESAAIAAARPVYGECRIEYYGKRWYRYHDTNQPPILPNEALSIHLCPISTTPTVPQSFSPAKNGDLYIPHAFVYKAKLSYDKILWESRPLNINPQLGDIMSESNMDYLSFVVPGCPSINPAWFLRDGNPFHTTISPDTGEGWNVGLYEDKYYDEEHQDWRFVQTACGFANGAYMVYANGYYFAYVPVLGGYTPYPYREYVPPYVYVPTRPNTGVIPVLVALSLVSILSNEEEDRKKKRRKRKGEKT